LNIFAKSTRVGDFPAFVHQAARFLIALSAVLVISTSASAQNQYEKRPISRINILITGINPPSPLHEQYRLTARNSIGSTYSTPRIRDAIEALYRTGRIDTITVSAALDAAGGVEVTFDIKPKTQAGRVEIEIGNILGDAVTEEELILRLNLPEAGEVITEQTLRDAADEILSYLRERGFYRSTVRYERRPLQNANEVGVTFYVDPNEQATVESMTMDIDGYTKPFVPGAFELRAGREFSRARLTDDVVKVRQLLREEDFLAPELDEPHVVYDSDRNTISVRIRGRSGPKVEVEVVTEQETISERVQNTLLPVKREGTLDYSAIVEGERRLENYYQERGYFFSNVTPRCSVVPQIADLENRPVANETEFLCSYMAGEDLMGRAVTVKYHVDLGRRLRVSEIRIRGTDKLTIEDVRSVLRSKESNALGIIPIFGLGRGVTSEAILEEDRQTLKSIMRELGYPRADVRVNRGVSINGEDLIITFEIEEGVPSVIAEMRIVGNTAIPTSELMALLPPLTGKNYSRARARNAARTLSKYYADRGYFDARVIPSLIETSTPGQDKQDVTVEFRVENEGRQVRVNRVLVGGNEDTKTAAILRAVPIRPGDLLKAADVYASEQNLYSTDAFSRVEVIARAAADLPTGEQLRDVVISVDEQPARLMTFGGGFSTDLGLSGFFDLRHVNLFGNLWQGGARIRVSQRQQLVQFDFINPRFLRDGAKRHTPLTLSLQYQRDTTVTRFFRSALDRGTFGIVQRIDEDGNPIDEFGARTGSPTLNRFTATAEASRTISRAKRSILFVRYRYEDVRLYNIDSLLVKELLLPDAKTRISGFSATFAFDTRRNCAIKYSLLDLISKGDQTEPCRYSASDPTNGQFATVDYNVSLPVLGANVGFQKVQASYNYYYSFPGIAGLRNTTFAARGIIGLGQVFSNGNRFSSTQYPELNGLLPISERFFAGGSNTLRGFGFEEAGPRVVIIPQGTFRNSSGDPVTLGPFTIPYGGNALAVVNLEGRIPLTNSFRVVPFYDGGGVFRSPGDVFRRPQPSTNISERNSRVPWTHTVGLGIRLRTPVGGEFGIDYGRLLNPPSFLIPSPPGPPAVYTLRRDQIHFRFSQAF
jgi:outer membrane protein insertion porin family